MTKTNTNLKSSRIGQKSMFIEEKTKKTIWKKKIWGKWVFNSEGNMPKMVTFNVWIRLITACKQPITISSIRIYSWEIAWKKRKFCSKTINLSNPSEKDIFSTGRRSHTLCPNTVGFTLFVHWAFDILNYTKRMCLM